MITKPIKLAIYVVIGIVAVIVGITVYRKFFLFDRKKISSLIETEANGTGSPNDAYKIINEVAQSILNNIDSTNAVLAFAQAMEISKEQALVATALNQCYALGFLEATVDESES